MSEQKKPKRLDNERLTNPQWEKLRLKWMTEGQPKVWKFLADNGQPNRNGGLRKRVDKWKAIAELEKMSTTVQNVIHLPSGKVADAEKAQPINPELPPARTQQEADAWMQVMKWREKQAVDDYRTADQLRSAIRVILARSVERVDENGKPLLRSNLRPGDARQLAQALESIQRIQRLSLGLSTDNVGLSMPASQTHVEKEQPMEEAIPIFTVEIGKTGKFIRPRPRRTN